MAEGYGFSTDFPVYKEIHFSSWGTRGHASTNQVTAGTHARAAGLSPGTARERMPAPSLATRRFYGLRQGQRVGGCDRWRAGSIELIAWTDSGGRGRGPQSYLHAKITALHSARASGHVVRDTTVLRRSSTLYMSAPAWRGFGGLPSRRGTRTRVRA